MLSDEQRKRIEQAIDGKATTRPLDDGTIKASRWIHAGAAEDIAEKLCPLIEQWISEAAGAALDAHRCDDQTERAFRRAIVELIAEVKSLREEVAEVRAHAAADGALMHAWRQESEAAADERDELRAQVERVRGVADRWEQVAAYRSAARAVREALEGDNDDVIAAPGYRTAAGIESQEGIE